MSPAPGVWDEFRELQILDELDRRNHVSQRELAELLGTSVGTVNRHLRELIDEELVRADREVRPFAYQLTPEGQRRRQRLFHERYESILGEVREMRNRIASRLRQLKEDGVERLVFYGAGDVMEATYPVAREMGFEVVGVVDDDPRKQGETRKSGLTVHGPEMIGELEPDAVLITTFRHADRIRSGMGPELQASVEVREL